MQTDLVNTIGRVGVFIICARVLVHFRPEHSYEKYLKMLVGIMILLLMLQPFARFFHGMDQDMLTAEIERFERQLQDGMEEAAERGRNAERQREQMTLEEIDKRLEAEWENGAEAEIERVEPVEEIRVRLQRPEAERRGE